jgi:hypothetical protein
VDAIVGLDGRRVLAVVPLVDGTELIFDGDYNGNLVTVDSDGSFHIGSANIEALAEHDPIYAGIWDRLNGNVTDLTVVHGWRSPKPRRRWRRPASPYSRRIRADALPLSQRTPLTAHPPARDAVRRRAAPLTNRRAAARIGARLTLRR